MSAINTGRLPYQKPDKITLSPKQRAKKRRELFNLQRGKCAACGKPMVWEMGFDNSATLDHIVPEPMGCAKNDTDSNLRVICFLDNYEKGSKRI